MKNNDAPAESEAAGESHRQVLTFALLILLEAERLIFTEPHAAALSRDAA
jgi:hypothetical protein